MLTSRIMVGVCVSGCVIQGVYLKRKEGWEGGRKENHAT